MSSKRIARPPAISEVEGDEVLGSIRFDECRDASRLREKPRMPMRGRPLGPVLRGREDSARKGRKGR